MLRGVTVDLTKMLPLGSSVPAQPSSASSVPAQSSVVPPSSSSGEDTPPKGSKRLPIVIPSRPRTREHAIHEVINRLSTGTSTHTHMRSMELLSTLSCFSSLPRRCALSLQRSRSSFERPVAGLWTPCPACIATQGTHLEGSRFTWTQRPSGGTSVYKCRLLCFRSST